MQYQHQNNTRLTIRMLVLLYLAWMEFQLVQGCLDGSLGMPAPVIVLTIVFFAAVMVAIAVSSYKRWRKGEEKIAELWRQQEEDESSEYEDPQDRA